MKLGTYTACLHDQTLVEAVATLKDLGLPGLELNTGGFLPAPHIPVDSLLASERARCEFLQLVADNGAEITALNCNGNALHPDPEVSGKHARDLRRTIELAGKLGIPRVVCMSGLPAAHEGGRSPVWVVEPWDSSHSEVRDYQWHQVGLPFWKEMDALARKAGVYPCIEMHPHNLVYNPATMRRLVEQTGATNIRAEMDPSHLFWQGIDPVDAIEHLGSLVGCAAAKDVRINEDNCRINGVLDDRFTPPPDPDNAISLGGRYVLNSWPTEPSWQFVAVGRGHDVPFWNRFLAALEAVDPAIPVNIEHEDEELAGHEGLAFAARTLHSANETAAPSSG